MHELVHQEIQDSLFCDFHPVDHIGRKHFPVCQLSEHVH